MKLIKIPYTSFKTSKFIFGTGRIVNIYSKSKRLSLINSAINAGFTHFDTAPYYGFGNSEKDLGIVLKNKHNITISSKVGLHYPGRENQSMNEVFFRKIFGKFFTKFSRPLVDFTIQMAEKSLHASLRRLNKEIIDIYLLHDASLNLLYTEEWQKWVEKIKFEGKINLFGISTNSKNLQTFFYKNSYKIFDIIQIQDSLIQKDADILKKINLNPQITFGYISDLTKRRSKIDIKLLIKKIIFRNKTNAIIVSSRNIKNINIYKDIE
jgi:D-threo-aldose 1-dehydrogenase